MSDAGQNSWKAPATGTPLDPAAVASMPSAAEIASNIIAGFAVPKGPIRTVSYMLGAAGTVIMSGALNNRIASPILAAPGIIESADFIAQLVTTGAAAGVLQLFDGDSNAPLLRTYPFNVGAAGSYSISFSMGGKLPFLQGINAVWTPITAAFGACIIVINIDFNSIPIGQR